jgi:hypothetical protein
MLISVPGALVKIVFLIVQSFFLNNNIISLFNIKKKTNIVKSSLNL